MSVRVHQLPGGEVTGYTTGAGWPLARWAGKWVARIAIAGWPLVVLPPVLSWVVEVPWLALVSLVLFASWRGRREQRPAAAPCPSIRSVPPAEPLPEPIRPGSGPRDWVPYQDDGRRAF